MRHRQWRMITDLAKKLNCSPRFKPVSILEGHIAMECALSVQKVKSHDAERCNIVVDHFWATHKAQQDVGRCIVAEGDSHLHKRPQRHVNICIRILVLQGTVGLG